jgi:hypothetical protein
MLFKEIIASSYENHDKHKTTLRAQNSEILIDKTCGTYSYHWTLKNKKHCPSISLKKMKTTTKKSIRIAGSTADILSQYLSKTSLDFYSYRNLFRGFLMRRLE